MAAYFIQINVFYLEWCYHKATRQRRRQKIFAIPTSLEQKNMFSPLLKLKIRAFGTVNVVMIMTTEMILAIKFLSKYHQWFITSFDQFQEPLFNMTNGIDYSDMNILDIHFILGHQPLWANIQNLIFFLIHFTCQDMLSCNCDKWQMSDASLNPHNLSKW